MKKFYILLLSFIFLIFYKVNAQTSICTNSYSFTESYYLDSMTIVATSDMTNWVIDLNSDQIFYGQYNHEYTFNQGYLDWTNPPLRVFTPPLLINIGDVLTQTITTSTGTTTGCALLYLTNHPTSIKPQSLNNELSITPNPNNGIFMVEIFSGDGSYQLYDLAGKLLLEGNVNTTKFNLDVSSANAGIYFFTLQTNAGLTTKKIEIIK